MTTLKALGLIAQDAESDARALDGTPFTPGGIGPHLGGIYASIEALANICADQQRQIDTLKEVHGT